MINAVIIGAGQLGSRHLQGLVKSKNDLSIYVVDPNKEALETADLRSKEISHKQKITFQTEIRDLPRTIDFAVIATNANVRLQVLQALVVHASIKTLILEKVLFQHEDAYNKALELIESHSIQCYVNHPRRAQYIYQKIKHDLKDYSHVKFDIDVFGVNWGLGCNGLHVSDLIEYLFSDEVNSYSIDELDQSLLLSKRKGFNEFTGTIKGNTLRGHSFRITSSYAQDSAIRPITITLNSPEVTFWVSEAGIEAFYLRETNGLQVIRETFKVEPIKFQSDLTGNWIDLSISGEKLPLTEYEQAMRNHCKFINALLDQIEIITGIKTKICPIT